jgi:aspartyl-tRNA(Asn)/glutamyl-tRNA(Gln) amidotransferase subunit B
MNNKYEIIIGVEVHVQLKTKTKLLCACPAEFGGQSNTNICPICSGLPGVLPTMNQKAVELAIKAGLSLNCHISEHSSFARKHYFYPDLPKCYQITQYKEPLATNGFVIIDNKKIRIRRLHLEEDSGKSIHSGNESLVDFNRCGIPLIEIVTEPDLHSPEQAVQYLQALRQIMRYLDVSDCDMEKAHFRCEPNISIKPVGQEKLGVRTELKNLNSMHNVREALEFEYNRQSQLLDRNGVIIQETLFWDEQTKTAGTMRGKEESEDYRYFPEPDLPLLQITQEKIDEMKKTIPLLPWQRKQILVEQMKLPVNIADIIAESKEFADYFENTLKYLDDPKLVANWLVSEVRAVLNQQSIPIQQFPISPQRTAELLKLLKKQKITNLSAKQVFAEMTITNKSAQEIAESKQLFIQEDDELLSQTVKQILEENQEIVLKYKNGKTTVLGYLIGAVSKKTQAKISATKIKETILKQLK